MTRRARASAPAERLQSRLRYRFRRDAEMAIEVIWGCACAEAAHADEDTVAADDLIPALAHRGLYSDLHRSVTDDCAPRVCGSRQEQLEAGHRDHPGREPAFAQEFSRLDGDRDLGARCEQRNGSDALGRNDLIGPAGTAVALVVTEAELRYVLARQRQNARTIGTLQRQLPALGDFDGIARAEDRQVRHRAQRGQMLDRLVGRTVLAEPDRVVGHHMNDALPHERGETNGRAAVIG